MPEPGEDGGVVLNTHVRCRHSRLDAFAWPALGRRSTLYAAARGAPAGTRARAPVRDNSRARLHRAAPPSHPHCGALLQGLPYSINGVGDLLALFRCISCKYKFSTDSSKPQQMGAGAHRGRFFRRRQRRASLPVAPRCPWLLSTRRLPSPPLAVVQWAACSRAASPRCPTTCSVMTSTCTCGQQRRRCAAWWRWAVATAVLAAAAAGACSWSVQRGVPSRRLPCRRATPNASPPPPLCSCLQRCRVHSTLFMPLYSNLQRSGACLGVFEVVLTDPDVNFAGMVGWIMWVLGLGAPPPVLPSFVLVALLVRPGAAGMPSLACRPRCSAACAPHLAARPSADRRMYRPSPPLSSPPAAPACSLRGCTRRRWTLAAWRTSGWGCGTWGPATPATACRR